MYDAKPEVLTLLESIPNITVSDQFPAGNARMPHITFKEADNSNYHKMRNEVQSEIVFLIDVWNNRSTGALAAEVNKIMSDIGFIRELAADLNEPNGLKRKTMRFRGVVDKRTKLVYQ